MTAHNHVEPVIRIAIDCMGGDTGISVTVPAAFDFAARFPDTELLLVGLPDELSSAVSAARKKFPTVSNDRYRIVPASEVVPRVLKRIISMPAICGRRLAAFL